MKRVAPRIALLLVLLLAAGLRWWQPGLVEFKYDEAHTVGLALDIASGGPFPLTSGGTSIGLERPALDAYLLAIPLLLGRIEAAVWWSGALGVLAVALVYNLGRRLGGPLVGLLAALYMAANPWLVLYDRKLWSHIQVVLSVALLLLAWEIVVRARGRTTFWFVVLGALQCLSHVLALLQVLSWLAALLIAPRKWLNRRWLAGIGVTAGLLAPYFIGVASQNRSAHGPLLVSGGPPLVEGGLRNLGQALNVFGGAGVHALTGLPPTGLGAAANWVAWPLVALMLLGLVRVVRQINSGRPSGQAGRLLLSWSIPPLLVLALAPVGYQQYWTVLLPLPALFFAMGSDALLRRLPLAPRVPFTALAVSLLLAVWVSGYADVLAAVHRGQGLHTFGIPLSRWEAAVRAAVTEAGRADAAGIRIAVQGIDPRYQDEPAVMAALLHGSQDARLVVPGWPYFALIDPRYESDGNVVATESLRAQGVIPRGAAPGNSMLPEERSTVFLWALEDAGMEAMVARVGTRVTEIPLAQGRRPAAVYRMPALAEVTQHITDASVRLAAGPERGATVVAVNEPRLAALFQPDVTILPSAANDLASAEAAVARLADAGIRRIVFVEQPSGWWDPGDIARRGLATRFQPVGSWSEQIWTVYVYEVSPEPLKAVNAVFATAPSLRGYALNANQAAPGGLVVAHLAWEIGDNMLRGLKVSLQLLDAAGVVVAQVDRDLSESDLRQSSVSYGLRLPDTVNTGEHRLIAVVYDPATGQRLRAAGSDIVDLGPIQVIRPALP